MALKKQKLQKKRMNIWRNTIYAGHVVKALEQGKNPGNKVIVWVAVSLRQFVQWR